MNNKYLGYGKNFHWKFIFEVIINFCKKIWISFKWIESGFKEDLNKMSYKLLKIILNMLFVLQIQSVKYNNYNWIYIYSLDSWIYIKNIWHKIRHKCHLEKKLKPI